MQVLTN